MLQEQKSPDNIESRSKAGRVAADGIGRKLFVHGCLCVDRVDFGAFYTATLGTDAHKGYWNLSPDKDATREREGTRCLALT